jgi:hypothetical protein
MQPVASSWIARLGWEGVRGQPGKCYMETRDGNLYAFHGFPWTFFRLWLGAESKGKFYRMSVYKKYPETRVRYVANPNRT